MDRLELITSREFWVEKISNELYGEGMSVKNSDAYADKIVDEHFMNVISDIYNKQFEVTELRKQLTDLKEGVQSVINMCNRTTIDRPTIVYHLNRFLNPNKN